MFPQSPSPAARSKALSSSWCWRRVLHTDSKTNRMTEDSEPVEQHHCVDEVLQVFSKNIKSVRIYFLKKLIILFSNGCITLIKVTVKTFIMLQKIYILNKCCSFELSIHQRILIQLCHHRNKLHFKIY